MMSLTAGGAHKNGGRCYAGRYRSGRAVYFYDDMADGRLYRGKFWFSRKYYSHPLGKLTETATGCFDGNIKEGRWTFANKTHGVNKKLVVSYAGGHHLGTYSYHSVCHSRVFGFKTLATTLRLTMAGGHPVGDIVCVLDGNLLTGRCDADGRPDGLWKMDMGKTAACRTDYEEWEHGVCKQSYSIDEATGLRTYTKNQIPDIVKRLVYSECLPLENLVKQGSSAWNGDF